MTQELGNRDPMNRINLTRVRPHVARVAHPHNHRRDGKTGTGDEIIQLAQHLGLINLEVDFFMQLAERRAERTFARVDTPTR